MHLIEILLLFVSIVLCINVIKTDIEKSIINNKTLLIGGIAIIVLDSIYYTMYFDFMFVKFVINIIIVWTISILLYAFKFWGAGDSKLLMVLVLSIPSRFYYYEYSTVPLLELVVYIFTIGYIYILVESVVLFIKKVKSFKSDIRIDNIKKFIVEYAVATIYLSLSVNIFLRIIPSFYYSNPLLFVFFNIFLIIAIFEFEIFKSKLLIMTVLLSDILLFISSGHAVFQFSLISYVIIGILFLLRTFIARYNYKEISIMDLQEGMILSTASVAMLSSFNLPDIMDKSNEDLNCKLTATDISSLQKICRRYPQYEKVTIVNKIPFAIFIAAGYIFYLIMGCL